jgi:hypothetical protein
MTGELEMKCDHKISNETVWYPEIKATFLPVPVCNNCRTLKNISGDRGRGIGFYINILSNMKRHLANEDIKLSSSQMRLIIKELRKTDGFEDTYWIKGSVQKSIFIKSVQKFTSLSVAFIERFIQPS